jgi:predicted MFS family arabinose efflux permease
MRAATVLAAGFLITLFGGGSRFVIGLTLKPVVEEFGWQRGDLGIAAGVYFVITAICTVYAGRLADRMSMRMLLGSGLVVSGIGVGLMGFISAPWHALVLYGIIFAVGNGAVSTPPISVMVTRAFPGRTGLANSFVLSGITISQLVIIAALSFVLAKAGWRPVFFGIGLAHFVLIAIVIWFIPAHGEPAARAAVRPREGMTLSQAAHTRQFWLLAVIFAICGMDDFFVATHVVAFAQDRGLTPLVAGNLFAIMGLFGFIGVMIAGQWGDRSGPVWPTALSFLLRVLVFALLLVDQSPVSITIFCVVFGLTFLVTAPLTVLFVRDSFGMAHLGAISGIVTMVHMIFAGLGAWAGAEIFDATGRYDVAFVIVGIASFVALVLTLCLNRQRAGNPA